MRAFILTFVIEAVFAGLTLAQPFGQAANSPATAATAPADPLEASRTIEQRLADLANLPIAQEMLAISKEISAAQTEAERKVGPLRKQHQQLYDSEDGKIYQKMRESLNKERNETWERDRKALAEAAKTVYAARHEELRKTAVGPVPNLGKLGFDVLSYPRIDGSTSTHPLSVIIACRSLGVPYEWLYPEPTGYPFHNAARLPGHLFMRVSGRESPMERMDMEFNLAASRVVAKPPTPAQERMAIIINSLLCVSANTHGAYENLINGKCDLNLTARGPSQDELKLAKEKGVTIVLKPIARDALIFIVNRKNGVNSLTHQQIVDIYDGNTTTWTDLGWTPAPKDGSPRISPLRRERNSGSRELFDALVMTGRQPREDKSDAEAINNPMFSYSMSGPFNRVTGEPGALGYTVYYYEHFMAASALTRPIAIDGVEPTPESIASGKYPFVAEVYAAYRDGEAADSPAMKMLNWIVSDEGQAVIKESGYVPAKK